MAYTTIDKSDDYFNTITYSGDGTSPKSITGVGFQPDWVWVKRRNGTTPHVAYDVVRGAGKQLRVDNTENEKTNQTNGYISAFESDGYEVTQGATNITRVNGTGGTYVAWNWLAQNGTSSNTDGSTTSTVSANTTSGFSVVTWTGTGSNATVGHGLDNAPKCVIIKQRTESVQSWCTYHVALGPTKFLDLNRTDAANTGSTRHTADPSSTVLNLGTSDATNMSGKDYVGYCFESVQGFSKMGSYEGNGSSDGAYAYTGFKPAWVMIKRTNSSGSWSIFDTKRDINDGVGNQLFADSTSSEASSTGNVIDILSNGFKNRGSGNDTNNNGSTYVYMAFAENPFVSSTGIPGLAR